jgi:hypothetical protein
MLATSQFPNWPACAVLASQAPSAGSVELGRAVCLVIALMTEWHLATRLASRIFSNAITASSAKRIRVHLPLRRGRTSVSNHSSSTWCGKMFERQGEITPPWGEPSVAWRRRPSSRTPAFSHLSIS